MYSPRRGWVIHHIVILVINAVGFGALMPIDAIAYKMLTALGAMTSTWLLLSEVFRKAPEESSD
jgi:hypothetical protein